MFTCRCRRIDIAHFHFFVMIFSLFKFLNMAMVDWFTSFLAIITLKNNRLTAHNFKNWPLLIAKSTEKFIQSHLLMCDDLSNSNNNNKKNKPFDLIIFIRDFLWSSSANFILMNSSICTSILFKNNMLQFCSDFCFVHRLSCIIKCLYITILVLYTMYSHQM